MIVTPIPPMTCHCGEQRWQCPSIENHAGGRTEKWKCAQGHVTRREM